MKFKLRRYYIYYAARFIAFIFYMLPMQLGFYVAEALGRGAFLLLSKYRKLTIDNLKSVFGEEKADEEIYHIGEKVFVNLAKNAVELVNFPRLTKDNIDKTIDFRGTEIFKKAFEKGKGIIVLTAHFGNWELVGATLRIKGYPGHTIGRRIYFKKYDEYLNSLRRMHDVHVVYRDESPRKILKILKENKIMGIVADQDVDSIDGVFVNFFGKPAFTPSAPVALAKVTGAQLIPVFIVRQGMRHIMFVEEPIELIDTGDKEKDLINNTQKWSNVVESYIRKYPEQWVWMHRRWKTKTKG